MATKTTNTAEALAEASAAHLANLLTLREQAMGVCAEQSGAIEAANAALDEAVTAANTALAGAIGEVNDIDGQLSALGHEGDLDAAPRMPRGFGAAAQSRGTSTRKSGRKSKGRRSRASNRAGLNDSILMAMNLAPTDEWQIPDIVTNLEVVGWNSKATPDSLQVQISNALSALLGSRFVSRPSRGVYTITASGIKHAEAAAALIEAGESESE